MPSIRYVNQTAPFWDFVASLENQGTQHPFFNRGEPDASDEDAGPSWGPWGPWGGRGWHRGPMPHHPHHRGPPPPPGPHGPPPPPGFPGDHPPPGPPPQYDPEASPDTVMGDGDEKRGAAEKDNAEAGSSAAKAKENECEGREGCRRRMGGRCHGRGGFGARRGPWGRHGHSHGGFPFGPFMFGGLNQGPGNAWADFLREQIFGEDNKDKDGEQADFKPELDVFDNETSYVIHVSLPGAKKEDVGVNWDPEKSELSVAGVVYRPGDEELLKNLAMDGRKVGPFESKVRLGSRANPAQVDADAITAKLEDGVLVVEVPKLDKDYVEIKKVDIE